MNRAVGAPLGASRREDIKAALRAGTAVPEIARTVGCSDQTVYNIRKAMRAEDAAPAGVAPARGAWSADEFAQLQVMAAGDGLTVDQLVVAIVRDVLADDAGAEGLAIVRAPAIDTDRLVRAVLAAHGAGISEEKTATTLGLQPATVAGWLAAWRAEQQGRKAA